MSTWTNKARAAALMGLCLISAVACVGPLGWAPQSLTLAGGGPIIAGPPGFCVDLSQTRDNPQGAFVLFGSCAALSLNPSQPRPSDKAVLTATVMPPSRTAETLPQSFPQMRAFFASDAGRAALSRSGQASTVKVLQTVAQGDVLFIELTDSSASTGTRVQAQSWRAVTGVKGRIVSVSVLGLAEQPLASATLRALAEAFVRSVQQANANDSAL